MQNYDYGKRPDWYKLEMGNEYLHVSVGVTMLQGDCVWPGGGGGGVTTIINTLTAQLGSARRNEERTLVAAVVQQTAPPIITIMLLPNMQRWEHFHSPLFL